MEQILNIQQQLLPDLVEVMRKRYEILRHIQLMQPVGRRSLATTLHLTERVLRGEVDFLRIQGLIQVDSIGMHLTPNGAQLVSQMEPLIKELFGLAELELELQSYLKVGKVVVVPGDADQSDWVKMEMGRTGAQVLKQLVDGEQIIAVAGGSTMLAVAEMMMPTPVFKMSTFVPTRGGVGEAVELEANYIASLMAKKTGGKYRLMHVPDQLSEESYQTLIREPQIQEVLQCLRSAHIVLHGLGDAKRMALRRQSSHEVMEQLKAEGAVGEAFGYYFDSRGEIVHHIQTVGLRLQDVNHAVKRIAVAGGISKAAAISAICPTLKQDVLVTDEGAARAILQKRSF
ncbi:sugar-binding transcriptional regulator [Hazenella coriacea]|uniref:Central glycolytic genes regulator n=1 Tax=Hazenella coriacea TaxID=1179467 RepID=A0A4R3L7V9_9BACL|nr:sugar-binding domain-containing protein [Hazenella coriacea]TCS95719.1 central glycolytic genes regulator [Hazenella coriacea]